VSGGNAEAARFGADVWDLIPGEDGPIITDKAAARSINWTMAMALGPTLNIGAGWIVLYESGSAVAIVRRLGSDERRQLATFLNVPVVVVGGVRWLAVLTGQFLRAGTASGKREAARP
jgi:hypothetical protein